MTTFHHCSKTFSGKLQIIKIQWLYSTTAEIRYIEMYKSYNINGYIQPLGQEFLKKIANYINLLTIFHHGGNPLHGNLQIIQH